MIYPAGAVVFVNDDLVVGTEEVLMKQLYLDRVVDGYVYDDEVAANSDYPEMVRLAGEKLLVRRSLDDMTNRETADLVLFVKHGLAAVLKCNFGPHEKTVQVSSIGWKILGFHGGNHSIL